MYSLFMVEIGIDGDIQQGFIVREDSDNAGKLVKSGFSTTEEAWDWLDTCIYDMASPNPANKIKGVSIKRY